MNKYMLSYNEFLETAIDNIPHYMPERYEEIVCGKTIKNNGAAYDSIRIVVKDRKVVPLLYGEELYSRYQYFMTTMDSQEALAATLKEGVESYYEHLKDVGDTSLLLDRERIVFDVINYEANKAMLENCPYERKGDLAIAYYILVDKRFFGEEQTGMSARIRITNDIADTLGLTKEELSELAMCNSERLLPASLRGISQVLSELVPDTKEWDIQWPEKESMYVLTNHNGLNGAGVMFYRGIFESYEPVIGRDFYILPASIHEVLIVPSDTCMNVAELRDIVKNVNSTSVEWKDFLSNRVYTYDSIRKDIVPAVQAPEIKKEPGL